MGEEHALSASRLTWTLCVQLLLTVCGVAHGRLGEQLDWDPMVRQGLEGKAGPDDCHVLLQRE